jgi:hypothetical protein
MRNQCRSLRSALGSQPAKVREALDGISLEEAFAQIQARRTAAPTPDKSVKQVEVETPAASKEEIGSDQPEGVFYARSLPKTVCYRPWMKPIERIVLVYRLREVVGQVRFTRFGTSGEDWGSNRGRRTSQSGNGVR